MRDGVWRERIEAERDQAGDWAGQVAGESEDDQPEQQGQDDYRQPGQEEQVLGVVALLVQDVVAELPLGASEVGATRASAKTRPVAMMSLARGGCS